MVIDAYDGGWLWRRDEMEEMFEVDELTAASLHEMVGSMYRSIQNAYWSLSTRSGPEIAFLAPLSVKSVVEEGGYWPPLCGYEIKRAIASAEMRMIAAREDPKYATKSVNGAWYQAAMDYALLLFHSGSYEEAWVELSLLLDEAEKFKAERDAAREAAGDGDEAGDEDLMEFITDDGIPLNITWDENGRPDLEALKKQLEEGAEDDVTFEIRWKGKNIGGFVEGVFESQFDDPYEADVQEFYGVDNYVYQLRILVERLRLMVSNTDVCHKIVDEDDRWKIV